MPTRIKYEEEEFCKGHRREGAGLRAVQAEGEKKNWEGASVNCNEILIMSQPGQ